MSVRIHVISSLTKSVDRMATLISIFAFSKRPDVSLINHSKKFVMVRAALIQKAVRLTSHQRINIQTIAYFGITNADISWSVFSANLDDLSPSLEICPCPASSNDLFQFVEGWVNTETLVGSLQTEAGNKSKDEIKSFLADFEIEDDIGMIFTFFLFTVPKLTIIN